MNDIETNQSERADGLFRHPHRRAEGGGPLPARVPAAGVAAERHLERILSRSSSP